VAELLLGLLHGDGAVVTPDSARSDGRLLARVLDRHGVRTVHATPTTWARVVDAASDALAGRIVLIGSEPVPGPLARLLTAASGEVHEVQGLPAAGVWATDRRLGDTGASALAGVASVRTPGGRALPVGVRGELCLGGTGYGTPLLPTGLLAAWRPDGDLDVVGRLDAPVPSAVEDALVAHTDVAAAVVVPVPGPHGDELVAVVQAADKANLIAELARHADALLPPPSRPARYVRVDVLPETVRHTVDTAAVAQLARTAAQDAPAARTDASDPALALVVTLFGELLGRDGVTADTNFFNYGGHSLLAAQLAQHLEKRTGTRLTLSAIFAHPTPAMLAEQLAGSASSSRS
jgi:acyl carrier protein